jgi:hypothetical protein
MGLTMCAEDRKCNFVGEIPESKFGCKNNQIKKKELINFKESLIYTKSDLVRRKEKKILSLENKLEKLKRELNNLK